LRDGWQKDLFRARLDQIVDMIHSLAKLARAIDWGFLEQSFGAVYADVPGRPPLPTRLMAGASSPTAAIAATMRRKRTSSGWSSRDGAAA
jgi:hypothetical protein